MPASGTEAVQEIQSTVRQRGGHRVMELVERNEDNLESGEVER